MFLSYELLSLDVYDHNRWKFKIIDSEWEAVAVAVGVALVVGVVAGVEVGVAVIQEYSKRELPVAANLIRAFQWYSSKYGFSIQQLIDWNKQYNPQYKQYEEEVDRLLVLL